MKAGLILGALALLVAGFVGGAWVGGRHPIFPRPEAVSPSVAEARGMSREALVARVLDVVGADVAHVSSPPPHDPAPNVDNSLGQIDLFLKPVSGQWPGLCAATVVMAQFDTMTERAQEPNYRPAFVGLSTREVYRIIGPSDPNGSAAAPTDAQCRDDDPGRTLYLSAKDSRAVSEAARIVTALRAAGTAEAPLPFPVACDMEDPCPAPRAMLTALRPDQLYNVGREEIDCPPDRTCLELGFLSPPTRDGAEPFNATVIEVVADYRGQGAKGWGVLTVESVRVKRVARA